jgi:protein-L-isoaspartate O-methyltransferase
MSRHPQTSIPHRERTLPPPRYLAPCAQTPPDVVARMLALAGVGAGDVVVDLGAGDGRVVVAAAQTYGVRAVGYEIDHDLISDARRSIREAGLEHLAEIRAQDILAATLTEATVVTLFLTSGANIRVRRHILEQVRPQTRIVSHEFGMGMWRPTRVERMRDANGVSRTLYLWRL